MTVRAFRSGLAATLLFSIVFLGTVIILGLIY